MPALKQKSVTVVIVVWNSERYIQDVLQSIIEQTYKDVTILVIDNGSIDETVKIIRTDFPQVRILQNFRNLGFAKAYNQGMKLARTDLVLIMNHDVIMHQDAVKQLVKATDRHPQAGSWSPKLYTLFVQDIDPESQGSNLKEFIKSDKLDAAGLEVFKSRQVQNRGEGESDAPQYNTEREVFGFTGACVLFSKDVLDQIAVRGQYFDETFFAYKEDFDLSWRMLLYGFDHWFIPAAVGWHFRSFKRAANESVRAVVANRRQASFLMKLHSLTNNQLVLIKNDDWQNFLKHLPWIIGRNIMMLGYSLFFDPGLLFKSVRMFFKALPTAISSRRIIKSHQQISPAKIRRWFK